MGNVNIILNALGALPLINVKAGCSGKHDVGLDEIHLGKGLVAFADELGMYIFIFLRECGVIGACGQIPDILLSLLEFIADGAEHVPVTLALGEDADGHRARIGGLAPSSRDDELEFDSLRVTKDYNRALGELMLAPFPANCYMVNKNRYVIDDAGLLYKCQRHLGKAQFSCGNVKDGPVFNEIYKYYVTANLHDETCKNCNILPICQGGCNASRLLNGDKFACPPSKTIIEKLVLKYYKYLTDEEVIQD